VARGKPRRSWLRNWLEALPTLLGVATALWVVSTALAAFRGFNTHDPLVIAYRLAMTAGICLAAAVVAALGVQATIWAIVALQGRGKT
jgi:hypothetical protein